MEMMIDSKEAAKRLGLSLRRIQQLIAQRRLPAITLGGSYAIDEKDLAKVRKRRPVGRPRKRK